MLIANVCARFISFCYVNAVLGFVFVSSWCLVHMGSTSSATLPVVYKAWGYIGVPPAGHAP